MAEELAAALTFFVLNPERHLLYLRIHHLAIDCYGMLLIANQIAAHYTALVAGAPAPAPLPPPSHASDEDAAYRTRLLRRRLELVAQPRLAASRPSAGRSAAATTCASAANLPPDLAKTLVTFAQTHGLGWPDVLRALTGAYLARRTGGETLIGLPYPARIGENMASLPCTVANVLPHHLRPGRTAPLPDWLALQSARAWRRAAAMAAIAANCWWRELGLTGMSRLYGAIVKVQPFENRPVFRG